MPRLGRTGFSLLEVIMSLVLLSFMMLGTYTMIDNSQNAKDSVTVEDNALLQVQMALNRLESDFSQIYSPIYYSPKSKARKVASSEPYSSSEQFPVMTDDGHPIPRLEHPDESTLVFMTTSNRRKMQEVKQARWSWVHYSLEDVDSGTAWVRKSTAANPFAPQMNWDEVRPQVLMRNVKSILFKFWDVDKKEWVEDWEDDPQKRLYAIKVALTWVDANEVEQTSIRAFRALWPYPNFFFNLLRRGR